MNIDYFQPGDVGGCFHHIYSLIHPEVNTYDNWHWPLMRNMISRNMRKKYDETMQIIDKLYYQFTRQDSD